jgi:membrane protein
VRATISQPRARPGSFVGLLHAAWREYERDHARYFASAMVYHTLVSLVPLLLLLLAVLGLLLRFSESAAAAEQQVLLAVESSFGRYLRTTVERLFDQLQQESVLATVTSLVGLMLTASALFRHLRLSFRAIWKYAPPLVAGPVRVALRATALEHVMSYVMVLAGGLVLVAAVVLFSVTQWLGDLLIRVPLISRTPAWLLALPGSVIVVALLFALLFRFLPPVRLRWRHVWLPAALCTAAWTVGAEMVVLFGALFGGSPSASGAFGGLLVMMLWINIVCQLLFFGAELCKVIAWRDGVTMPASPCR